MFLRFRTMLMVFAVALLATAAGGCVEPLDPEGPTDQTGPEITILIRLPGGSRPSTKAVSALDDESKVYSLQVWVYLNGGADTDLPLAYSFVNGINGWKNVHNQGEDGYNWNDDVYQVVLHLPGSFLRMNPDDMQLDFYALVNGESIGLSTSAHYGYWLTRTQVRDMTFGRTETGTVDPFGATACLSVPSSGLPMSGFGGPVNASFLQNNPNPSSSVIQQYIPVIQLQRAVSRIRFAFSRLVDMDYVSIKSIRLIKYGTDNGGVIPKRAYVFSHSENGVVVPFDTDDDYETVIWRDENHPDDPTQYPILPYSVIPETRHPEDFVRRPDESIDDFDARLWEDKDSENPVTIQRLLYFRETDRHLAVAVDCAFKRYDDESQAFIYESVTTTIPLQGENVVFPRNYTANLYAYFVEDAIHFSISCDPWISDTNKDTVLTPPEDE